VSGRSERAPRVEVWQQDDGEWRWRYVGVAEEDGEPLALVSNEPEPSEEEAVSAARTAYPGIPVEVPRRHRPPEPEEPKQWVWTGTTVALSLALAAVAVRYRRWWVAPLAPLLAHGVVARLRATLP
jgi:hypothetical protein